MQYKLNDLLEDADVAELTAETFAAPKKDTRIWRRVGVLAACAVLVVGLANAGALAAGIRQVWSYITGVGAVAGGGEIWVQSGPAETTVGDCEYRVRDAYRQDGYIYLTVDVLFQNDPREADGGYPRISVSASLYSGEEGRLCYAFFGLPDDEIYRQEQFITGGQVAPTEELRSYSAQMGYGDITERLDGAAAIWSHSMCFRDEGTLGAEYRLSVWTGPEGDLTSFVRPPEATIALTMEPGTASPVETYRTETPYGELSLLVSDNGKKIQLLMERAENDIFQTSWIVPLSPCFVDADGKRYAAVPKQLNSTVGSRSMELTVEGTPGAPIVSIELPGYRVGLEDTSRPAVDGGRFTDYRVEDLNWNVSLK